MTALTARQKALVERNVGLAQKISHDYIRSNSLYELEDIVSAAYQGLIQAALLFDPHRPGIYDENAFAGYARQKINGAILDWMKSGDYVPRGARQIYKKISSLGYGRERSLRDIEFFAAELEVSEKKIRAAVAAVENPSLSISHRPDADDQEETTSYTNSIPSGHDVEESTFAILVQDAVATAFDEMPTLHRTVIAMRYYGHYELQNISMELGISLTLVREIHSEAILQIHQAMVSHLH